MMQTVGLDFCLDVRLHCAHGLQPPAHGFDLLWRVEHASDPVTKAVLEESPVPVFLCH
jgi:hypothetical protein